MEYLIALLVGLILGSFYNVVIHRLPEGKSVIFPPSSCPKCGSRIRWYDNIPLLSYLLLRGRCRDCGATISIRYPIVELSSGLLAVLSLWLWGTSLEAILHYLFFSSLLVMSIIDLKLFILPDEINIPGIFISLAVSFFRHDITPLESLLGASLGFGLPFLIYIYYVKVRKMEGLGFGDVKLLTFIGAFGGVYGVLASLMLGSLLGLMYALPFLIKNKNLQFVIPFGPFLSLGCFLGIVFKGYILDFIFVSGG
jgi:leader peptidase (prepilin peptidase)/N-methyltransferase